MGMYTEFFFRAMVSRKAPASVKGILGGMIQGSDDWDNVQLPDHPFFKTERWSSLFVYFSSYSQGFRSSMVRASELGDGYCDEDSRGPSSLVLFVHSELKNYGGEIEKFIDWVRPYLVEQCGEFIGYSLCAETDTPKLFYALGE